MFEATLQKIKINVVFILYRRVEQRQLAWLITKRSEVRTLLLQQKKLIKSCTQRRNIIAHLFVRPIQQNKIGGFLRACMVNKIVDVFKWNNKVNKTNPPRQHEILGGFFIVHWSKGEDIGLSNQGFGFDSRMDCKIKSSLKWWHNKNAGVLERLNRLAL